MGITTTSINDRNMQVAFREAVKLEPANFEYRLRLAQSFFDVSKPDFLEALGIWRKLADEAKGKTQQLEYLLLCQARVLVELEKREEARLLMDRVQSPVMKETKRKLLQLLAVPPKKTDGLPSTKETKPAKGKGARQTRPPSPDELFFDDNLKNLQEIAERLEEEKLLRDLKVDAVRASYDKNGRVRISLRGLVEVVRPEGHGRTF